MKHPQVIYQDHLNDISYRIVATIDNGGLVFKYDISDGVNSMNRPQWKATELDKILYPKGHELNFGRMLDILLVINKTLEKFDRIKEGLILE